MKAYIKPLQFDGAKFAARYGLSTRDGSFFVGSDGLLHVPDNLPDDPPIFEGYDPPVIRQTKFNAGAGDRNPIGFIEIQRGKFVPYFD